MNISTNAMTPANQIAKRMSAFGRLFKHATLIDVFHFLEVPLTVMQ